MRNVGSWPDEELLQDREGRHWHFVYLYGRAQRLFFWNDDKTSTGVAVFPADKAIAYSRIRELMKKLVASEQLRLRYKLELHFPLERHYSLVFASEEAELADVNRGD